MATITCHFHPEGLGINTVFSLVIPSEVPDAPKVYPVLWLLHGDGENAQTFLYGCKMQQLADVSRMLIVIPNLQDSFGCNMKPTPAWETYLVKNLPDYIWKHFPASDSADQNFLAGVGSGGYAAVRLALTYPERFRAAAGICAQIDLPQKYARGEFPPEKQKKLSWCFGPESKEIIGGPMDCFALAEKLKKAEQTVPELTLFCPETAPAYQSNLEFAVHLQKLGYPFMRTESMSLDLSTTLPQTVRQFRAFMQADSAAGKNI